MRGDRRRHSAPRVVARASLVAMAPKKRASTSVASTAARRGIRDGAIALNASTNDPNGALALLGTLRDPSRRPREDVADALVALERFFCERTAAGELAESRARRKRDEGGREEGVDDDARDAYLAWFAKHRRVFVERCVGCVVDGELDERARCLALGVIMECARCETPGKFSNELYEDALRRATRAKSWSEALLGTLKARYLTRVDVRYHTYGAMRKLAEELKTYAPGEGEAAAVDVARNVYDVLNATPRAFDDYRGDEAGAEDEDGRADFAAMLAKLRGESVDDEGEKKRGPWCEDAEGSVIDLEAAKKKRKTSGGGKPKWTEGARHRRAFSDAWLALLRADFPEDIYRKILMRLHVDVMPHMVNPQLLSDFCVDSIDVGGLTGMLALNGLFILMTQHGLEYPTFYNRLYELLDASCFHANHRRGFFSLMDVFLKSPALPAYLVASFIKRFARLALSAPPAGAMVCVGFIHNLLRRHKSCVVLVHRERVEGEAAKLIDADPFDADERDPAKTNALKSSLWEVETLRAHYFPQIPKMVALLERDLTDRVKTKELEMGDLCGASYGSLTAEELDARVKKVPLASRAEPFTSIFTTSEMSRCFDTFERVNA